MQMCFYSAKLSGQNGRKEAGQKVTHTSIFIRGMQSGKMCVFLHFAGICNLRSYSAFLWQC